MEPFQRLIAPQPGLPRRACGRSPRATASRWSSTRSSPASASPTAAPRSTTAWCPTWPPSARSWAAASRSPRSRAAADIMRHFDPGLDGTGDFMSAGRHAQRQPDRRRRRPRHPGRAAQARRLRAPLRDRHAPQAGARGGGPAGRGSRPRWRARRRCSRSTSPTGPSPTTAPPSPRTAAGTPRSPARCSCAGVVKAAQKFYVSLVHTDTEVARTLQVFEESLAAVAELPTERLDYRTTGGSPHGQSRQRARSSGTAARSRAAAGSAMSAAAAGALGATMLVPAPWRAAFGQAKPFKIGIAAAAVGRGGGRRQDRAGRRARWRSTASTRRAASTAGRSS